MSVMQQISHFSKKQQHDITVPSTCLSYFGLSVTEAKVHWSGPTRGAMPDHQSIKVNVTLEKPQ